MRAVNQKLWTFKYGFVNPHFAKYLVKFRWPTFAFDPFECLPRR